MYRKCITNTNHTLPSKNRGHVHVFGGVFFLFFTSLNDYTMYLFSKRVVQGKTSAVFQVRDVTITLFYSRNSRQRSLPGQSVTYNIDVLSTASKYT